MGNTGSVLGLRARGSAGFGGEGPREEYTWAAVEDSVLAAKTGIRFDAATEGVVLSEDGCTATSQSEAPVAVQARLDGSTSAGAEAGGALRLGWQFEVTVDQLTGGSSDFTVGLVAADATTRFSPGKALWGYGTGGHLRSPHKQADLVAPFEAGDTIKVALDLGEIAFYRNGEGIGRRPVAPGAQLYPCVVLGSAGDRASISLRIPRTSFAREAAAWDDSGWAQGDPLNDAFDPAKVRRLYPDDVTVGPMTAEEDVQPWLVEQHLWGTGLSADVLSSEAGKIVKAVHRRLAQHTDSTDPIRKIAEARARMVTLLREEILHDARTPYVLREQRVGLLATAKDGIDSTSERTAKAVSSGSFKIFLLITTSVIKTDPEIANAALSTMLDTIESIESGVLAENHPDRPSHISEIDLDSVNRSNLGTWEFSELQNFVKLAYELQYSCSIRLSQFSEFPRPVTIPWCRGASWLRMCQIASERGLDPFLSTSYRCLDQSAPCHGRIRVYIRKGSKNSLTWNSTSPQHPRRSADNRQRSRSTRRIVLKIDSGAIV
eukprot:COSAG02_NODE_4099_length_5777_cov_3.988728_3_plen_547_part_00